MKKLIIILSSIILYFMGSSISSMATDTKIDADNQPNLFIELCSDELIMCIFEKCLDTVDILEYFYNAFKLRKTLRRVDQNFKRFTQNLIKSAKRIAQERFVKDCLILDFPKDISKIEKVAILNAKLIGLFTEPQNQSKVEVNDKKELKEKEDALIAEAAKLIVAGADIHTIRLEYRQPGHPIMVSILDFIARKNLYIKLIPVLIMYKINIDEQNMVGNTALYDAVTLGNEEAVKAICTVGGNVNIQNRNKDTALHWLVKKIIQYQKYQGYDSQNSDQDEDSDHLVKHIIKRQDQEQFDNESRLKHERILLFLLQFGDINLKNKNGTTICELLADYDGDNQKLQLISTAAELYLVNLQNDEPHPLVSKFIKDFFPIT